MNKYNQLKTYNTMQYKYLIDLLYLFASWSTNANKVYIFVVLNVTNVKVITRGILFKINVN